MLCVVQVRKLFLQEPGNEIHILLTDGSGREALLLLRNACHLCPGLGQSALRIQPLGAPGPSPWEHLRLLPIFIPPEHLQGAGLGAPEQDSWLLVGG